MTRRPPTCPLSSTRPQASPYSPPPHPEVGLTPPPVVLLTASPSPEAAIHHLALRFFVFDSYAEGCVCLASLAKDDENVKMIIGSLGGVALVIKVAPQNTHCSLLAITTSCSPLFGSLRFPHISNNEYCSPLTTHLLSMLTPCSSLPAHCTPHIAHRTPHTAHRTPYTAHYTLLTSSQGASQAQAEPGHAALGLQGLALFSDG